MDMKVNIPNAFGRVLGSILTPYLYNSLVKPKRVKKIK
jgi:hypothetical protein